MGEEKDLAKAVLERAQESDGKRWLTCAEAFELAREFQAEIIEIGRICNRQDIRICKCQLDCFK